MKRLDDIDGLRAVAVLAVLVYHFEKSLLPLGYLGVDVFFAISGFVITKSIAEDLDRGAFGMGRFLMRRAKRLLPALGVTVAVSTVAGAALMPGRAQFVTAAAAAAGLSNVWLWISGADYFGTATEWLPLTHSWSLGVEEQFYLAFPLLLAFLHARKREALLPLSVIGGLSACLYLSVWSGHQMAAFYLAPFRIWELLAGSVVFHLHHRWRRAPTGLACRV